MAVDLDAISDYVWRMERTGSSPCYVGTKELREMIAELKAAREFMPAANTAKEIVKATKLLLSSEGIDQSQLKLYLKSLIEQYDEVTGTDGEK